MGKARFALLLLFIGVSGITYGQKVQSKAERDLEFQLELGQLQEMAMCHHAIEAAHHDGIALDQNPYYRYIVNSPSGHGSNVYPIPERCKNLETALVLSYAQFSADSKAAHDKLIHDEIGMTIAEISADAQFLTVVINKMELEGDKAQLFENKDKDIPQ
jgi:hypothetical protein